MFKIAILGCENSHADAFLTLIRDNEKYSDIEVCGVYSEEREAMEKLSKSFGVPTMKSFDELCGKKLDGLVITARHGDNHFKYAEPYIAEGIPMFIDKPITISEDEAKKFMLKLKESGVRICGGSSCIFHDSVLKLKKLVSEAGKDEIMGGFVRAPLNPDNRYGGFFFYAQHLVSMMTEIFGFYPKSVMANENGRGISVIVSYGDFDVNASYMYNNYSYFVGVNTKSTFEVLNADFDAVLFDKEFDEFSRLLHGEEQKIGYREFIAPVYIMNAMARSVKSKRLEEINPVPRI